MNCTACGAPAKPGQRFCTACGAALMAACRACGASSPPGARFCGECGASLSAPVETRPPDSELRPVTVLFADLSGFTALSGERDPEDVQRLLNDFFAMTDGVIVKLGGTVDKHIGDCVMAVFGAPVAHGDDAERAVAAAIGIRAGLAPLAQRYGGANLDVHCGLAAGTVLAASTGSDVHRPYTITGSSVNLAARLCDLAKRGEILLSEDLASAVAHRYASEDFGRHQLDGFAAAQSVFKLGSPEPRHETEATPFVGRKAELRQIEAQLDLTAREKTGRIIYVRGDAGIGKSRLLDQVMLAARQRQCRCLSAAVLSFGAGSQSQLRRLVTQALLGDDHEDPGAFVSRFGLGEREEAFLHDLLGMGLPARLARVFDTFDMAGRRAARAQTLTRIAGLAADAKPLFMTIEDLHWIDEDGLDVLAALAKAAETQPVTLLLTARPERDPLDAGFRGRIAPTPLTTIDLAALPDKDAQSLAEQMLAGNSGLVKEVLARAAGNPLFLVQLLHHKTGAGGEALPQSIQSLIVARLDRLSEADRRIVQTASVLGQRFGQDEIDHLMDGRSVPLRALVDAFLIRPGAQGFEFVHALVREATYGTLPKSRRQALHVKAAQWFKDGDRLLAASHLDQAQDPGAAAAYDAAAQGEWAIHHHESAIALNARALALAMDGRLKAELLTRRGEMLLETGQVPASLAVWPEALQLAGDERTLVCRANIGFAQSLRLADRFGEANAALDRAMAIADADKLLRELSRAHHLRGNLLFPQGRLAECLAAHQKALDFAREAGSVEAEARAFGGLGDGYYANGRMLSAYDAFTRCVALAREGGFGRIEAANLPMCAITALSKGEWREANDYNREALALAERAGARRAAMIAHHCSYFALFEADELDAARVHAAKSDEIAIALGAKRFEAESKMFFAELAMVDGKMDDARHFTELAYQLCEETGLNYMGPIVLGLRAELAADEDARARHIAKAQAILASGAPSHNHMYFNSHMMTASLHRRDWAAAEKFTQALEAYAEKEPFPWAQFLIDRARVLSRVGQGERSEEVREELGRVAAFGRKLNFVRATKVLDDAIAAF